MLVQNKQVSSLSSKNPRWPQDLQVKHILDHMRWQCLGASGGQPTQSSLRTRSTAGEGTTSHWMNLWGSSVLLKPSPVDSKCDKCQKWMCFLGKDTYRLYFVAGCLKCKDRKMKNHFFKEDGVLLKRHSSQSYGLMSALSTNLHSGQFSVMKFTTYVDNCGSLIQLRSNESVSFDQFCQDASNEISADEQIDWTDWVGSNSINRPARCNRLELFLMLEIEAEL